MRRKLPLMLSVQSLQAVSASAIARGPDGVQRLAQAVPGQGAAPSRAAPTPVPGVSPQVPPPTNLPRGALRDRVV